MKRNLVLCLIATSVLASTQHPGRGISCEKALEIVEASGSQIPLGLNKEEFAELVRRTRAVEGWDKFEAVIFGGSRSHFTFGTPPKTDADNPGRVTSDLDVQIMPSTEWQASPAFDREWFPANTRLQNALLHAGHTIVRPIEMIQGGNVIVQPLSKARTSNKDIENRIREAAAMQSFPNREAEKNFYLRELARKIGRPWLVHTTEAIVLIRENGSASQALKKKLRDSGFENILVIP